MNIDVRVLGYKELLLNLIQARDSFIRSAFFKTVLLQRGLSAFIISIEGYSSSQMNV